jgi:hypothetical protein
LFFNYALKCAIRNVQVIQDGLKLNGTHQLRVYADGDNILGGSEHPVKEHEEIFLVVSKEIGLEAMRINLSTRLCLEIRMPTEITV